MSDNMALYNKARVVPENAKKPINAGRLKGMTDINPMWRIQRLTEMFGPCGIGWWYDITKKEIVYDEITNTKAAFVDILLWYINPETGGMSQAIPGTGGSAFVAQERNGPYLSDEAFKMALTDALSVACKALGIGADVYWEAGRTKYNPGNSNASEAPSKAAEVKMAAKGQIDYINEIATDNQKATLRKRFGDVFERMTAADTTKVIEWLRKENGIN